MYFLSNNTKKLICFHWSDRHEECCCCCLHLLHRIPRENNRIEHKYVTISE